MGAHVPVLWTKLLVCVTWSISVGAATVVEYTCTCVRVLKSMLGPEVCLGLRARKSHALGSGFDPQHGEEGRIAASHSPENLFCTSVFTGLHLHGPVTGCVLSGVYVYQIIIKRYHA